MEIQTPELDKMSKVRDESQKIGEFLDWLNGEQNVVLAKYGERETYDSHSLLPIRQNTEEILAKYFDIDLKKCEAERQLILDSLRN